MTNLKQGYKRLFLYCIEQGYDYAKRHLEYKDLSGFEWKCPYEAAGFESYEHDAWWTGVEWYRARVH